MTCCILSSGLSFLLCIFLTNSAFGCFPRSTKSQVVKPDFCPVGQFGCTLHPSLCVPQYAICNKKVDCPDGSDEVNCTDHQGNTHWDSLFQKRPGEHLENSTESCKYVQNEESTQQLTESEEELLLEHQNTIETQATLNPMDGNTNIQIEVGAFDDWEILGDNINSGCICVSQEFLCQNLHLPNINFIPTNVKYLDLSGSWLDVLDFNSPKTFPFLHTLILSSCGIQHVAQGAFSKLINLKKLYLRSNHLSRLTDGAFAQNGNLRELFLGYNRISVLHSTSFKGLSSLKELDLRNNKLTGAEDSVYTPLTSLRILHLSNNEIEVVRKKHLLGLEKLEILSLSSNFITRIEADAFENLLSLQHLYLSWNRLRALEDHTFRNQKSLLNLNLNDNDVQRIEPSAFEGLENLQSLNLERNRFGELSEAKVIFGNMTELHHIYFDQFWMCWWAPHVRSCEPKGDGISSIENLLDNMLLRFCVWIMGLIAVFGNLFVIVSRMVLREPNKVHSFYIRNLAGADLLMGLFLLSIAFHDVTFRGEFLARQHSWRHSLTCQLSGMLSTLSSEASVLILALITLDRYLSIVRPFVEKTTTLKTAIGICMILWIVSFILSYLPLSGLFSNYFGSDFYTGNGLCLPLHIHNPYDPAWEYSFVLFVVLNSVAFVFICFAYGRMLRIIQSSSLMVRSSKQSQDRLLTKRFALVVLTDFVCWAPVIIAKVVAMSGVKFIFFATGKPIPSDLYAWLAVFALPVNASINPILYTVTTKLFKQQIVKMTSGFRKKLTRGKPFEDSTASLSIFKNRTQRTMTTSVNNRSLRKGSNQTQIHNIIQMHCIETTGVHDLEVQNCRDSKMDEIMTTQT